MNAAKEKKTSHLAALGRLLGPAIQGRGAVISSGAGLLAAALGLAAYGWNQLGHGVRNAPEYRVTAERLQVTPQPSWIPRDIREEVVRDGGLEQLSLLDAQVTVRVARAFALHAWVANVRRVSKEYPACVQVELDYRRPVAMVEVQYQTNAQETGWVLPVDDRGVLLPPQDFSKSHVNQYLKLGLEEVPRTGGRIGAVRQTAFPWPSGLIGTTWGDPRVTAGAQIAGTLEGSWKKLGLKRIVATQDASKFPDPTTYFVLETQDGRRITWGHAPGSEAPGEASCREKAARLAETLQARTTPEKGSDTPAPPTASIDLTGMRLTRP